MVNIKGLDQAEVLYALYMSTKPIGNGYLSHMSNEEVTLAGCARRLAEAYNHEGVLKLDYLNGKPMKLMFTKDMTELDTRLYDRDSTVLASTTIDRLRL